MALLPSQQAHKKADIQEKKKTNMRNMPDEIRLVDKHL
jgi:hypothetical protein